MTLIKRDVPLGGTAQRYNLFIISYADYCHDFSNTLRCRTPFMLALCWKHFDALSCQNDVGMVLFYYYYFVNVSLRDEYLLL